MRMSLSAGVHPPEPEYPHCERTAETPGGQIPQCHQSPERRSRLQEQPEGHGNGEHLKQPIRNNEGHFIVLFHRIVSYVACYKMGMN